MVYRRKTNARRSTGGRFRKRWYVNAGANLPFIGKTNISMGTGLTKRSIVNIVRNGLEERLHKYVFTYQEMSHNTHYTLNLLGNIPQGDNAQSRTGDVIHLDHLKISGWFDNAISNFKDRPTKLRMLVVKHDTEVLEASDSFGSGLGLTTLYHPNYNSFNVVNQTDSKKVTVLSDQMISLGTPNISGQLNCTMFDKTIRLGNTFTYRSGTNYGKNIQYYLVILACVPGGVTGTTLVGNMHINTDLVFKDSR